MDADRKVTCLKALQGLIWRDGYHQGELQGVVFDDVPLALRQWQAAGTPIFIYSSGSVEAQQLLFRYSNHGDLTPLLRGYFDTTTGPKREAASYRTILGATGQSAPDVVFATDVLAEAEAAHEAGLQAVLVVRPGNAPLPVHRFREASTLLTI
jgi:2,3-diketo-5-methylthio-1-phosphopentane phosphatase